MKKEKEYTLEKYFSLLCIAETHAYQQCKAKLQRIFAGASENCWKYLPAEPIMSTGDERSVLSKILKHRRIELGLTQKEVAEKLNVTHQTVSSWETGKSIPDVPTIITLSEFYSLSLDYMLKGGGIMKKFYIEENALDLGKNFSVADEEDKMVYQVTDTLAIPTRKKYLIKDAKDRQIGEISKQRWTFGGFDLPRYYVNVKGWKKLTVMRDIVSFKTEYRIEGEGLSIKGNWLGRNFKILKDGHEVGQVVRKRCHDKDVFEITVLEEQFEGLLICFMVTLDLVLSAEPAGGMA